MATDRASAVRSLSALADALPCYSLTLARDPEAELDALAGLLPELLPVGRIAEGGGA
jgi:hypothetical protein